MGMRTNYDLNKGGYVEITSVFTKLIVIKHMKILMLAWK